MTGVRSQKESLRVFSRLFLFMEKFMKRKIEYTTEFEQIKKLQEQGLKIENIEGACLCLRTYGYYNIVNSYKEPYIIIDDNGCKRYKEGTSFNQLFSLYQLDHSLRNSIMIAMLDLEEHLRAVSAEIIARNFGTAPDQYLQFKNYRDRQIKDPRFSLDNILNTLRKDAKYNDKNPIKYYRNTYHCVPPWVLFKGIFLSTLVNFVRLFKEKQKNELACKMYGLRDDVKHIDAITNLLTDTLFICLEYRNLAAHGGRVYNYSPRSKTRLSTKSSQCLEELIRDFNSGKNSYGLASLLFLLNLFSYKQPFITLQKVLIQQVDRHCSVYPQDVPMLSKITGTSIKKELMVWISHTSNKYHLNKHCSGLKPDNMVSLPTAMQMQYKPCKKCCANLIKENPILEYGIIFKDNDEPTPDIIYLQKNPFTK